MFKELTKENILKLTPNVSPECLKLSLEIEAQRKKAYKQGYADAIKAMNLAKAEI